MTFVLLSEDFFCLAINGLLDLLPAEKKHPAAYFHFIHSFGNGRRSYAREPTAKSIEWKCNKKCGSTMQRDFQVRQFANNNNNDNNNIPAIIGATGIVTRSLRKNLEAVPGKHSIDSLQNTWNITHNTESTAV